ncbi:MAG: ComF family protein [Ahrensia sp.]|nr:ComF family protein [Ahrensia sp.]
MLDADVTSSKRAQAVLSFARKALDGLLPPSCMACDARTERPGSLCPSCWSAVSIIEPPYCAVLGVPFSHDLGVGVLSAQAIADPPPFETCRSVARYQGPARQLVHDLKFRDRTDLAPWMATLMLRAARENLQGDALVIPVPLHPTRLLSRRYNQAAELARHMAKSMRAEFRYDLLVRHRATKQQVGLLAKEREANMRGAFRIPKGMSVELKGRKVVLVDDVYTTGATMRACARVLKRAGASRIDCATFALVAPGRSDAHI